MKGNTIIFRHIYILNISDALTIVLFIVRTDYKCKLTSIHEEKQQIREEDEITVCELFDQYERKGREEGEARRLVTDIENAMRFHGSVFSSSRK